MPSSETEKGLREALEMVKRRWTFDDRQQHTHTWHDWADCMAKIDDALVIREPSVSVEIIDAKTNPEAAKRFDEAHAAALAATTTEEPVLEKQNAVLLQLVKERRSDLAAEWASVGNHPASRFAKDIDAIDQRLRECGINWPAADAEKEK